MKWLILITKLWIMQDWETVRRMCIKWYKISKWDARKNDLSSYMSSSLMSSFSFTKTRKDKNWFLSLDDLSVELYTTSAFADTFFRDRTTEQLVFLWNFFSGRKFFCKDCSSPLTMYYDPFFTVPRPPPRKCERSHKLSSERESGPILFDAASLLT